MATIAFVATRELSYSRVAITQNQLSRFHDVDVYASRLKSYPLRMLSVGLQLVWAWLVGRLAKSDAAFVGFLAQPIFPLVRLLYRGPVISDAYFSIYDAMVNDKQKVAAKSLTGRFCFWLDRYMLRYSDLTFTDTNQHAVFLREYFAVDSAPIQRLWIGATNKPIARKREVADPSKVFQVFFWGGFIPLQGVETIVRAANLLKDESVQFTLFGSGQTFSSCQRLVDQLQLKNITLAGWKQPEDIQRQASQSDIALGIFGETDKAGRVIPNKAYEALAMGIPLITRYSDACNELLVDEEHCLFVEPGDPESLANKIRWACQHQTECEAMAGRGLKLFQQQCCPARLGLQMNESIGKLLAESSAPTIRLPTSSKFWPLRNRQRG